MNKTFTFKDSPPPLLRIHIDDISNIKPLNTKRLPELKNELLELNVGLAKDNMHIVIPATSRCIISIGSIFRIDKTLIETGNTDIRYDEGEKALDMYYKASSCKLYWDASHTNKIVILSINTNSPLIQEKIERGIINALGSCIISYHKDVMLIDAHGEYDATMGRITRICDMLSYEMSPNPHIYNDNDRYVSSGDDYYISIFKMNP
jgi:hypothetical protein